MLKEAKRSEQTQFSFYEGEGGLYYTTRWEQFCAMLEECGFKRGYEEKFICPEIGGFIADTEAILFNPDNGLVIHASSFGGDLLNQATLYGEIHRGICEFITEQRTLLTLCERIDFCAEGISFSKEIRKGFNYYVKLFARHFHFHNPWTKRPELTLLNYADRHRKGVDVRDITEEKLQKCSRELSCLMNI